MVTASLRTRKSARTDPVVPHPRRILLDSDSFKAASLPNPARLLQVTSDERETDRDRECGEN
jgi:hypothetical protein